MASDCETTASACGVERSKGECGGGGASCAEGEECGCRGGSCGGNPVDAAIGMWAGAFCRAMKEVQVELLKAKIQKAWGAKMDKAADAVVEAMGAQWQSMLAQAEAKTTLRERLQQLWAENRNK